MKVTWPQFGVVLVATFSGGWFLGVGTGIWAEHCFAALRPHA